MNNSAFAKTHLLVLAKTHLLVLAKTHLLVLAKTHLVLLAAILVTTSCQASAAQAQSFHLEASAGKLTGVSLLRKIPGYSGKGYVGEFSHQGDKVVFNLPPVMPGLYRVQIRYSSPYGKKGYELAVNGVSTARMFPQTGNGFAVQAAGEAEMRPGLNMVEVDKGWGYFDIDALTVTRVLLPTLRKPPARLADPKATASARNLMTYLVQEYGGKTISGQYEVAENNYIHRAAGKIPAIYGGDFMDYSPSRLAHGTKPLSTQQMLERAKAGQIITAVWHWNAPTSLLNKVYKDPSGKSIDARWYRGFYANASTFDVQQALANPNSREYALLLRDMDAIGVQLAKLQNAGVPVLWRPLHEAQEGGFWWGAKGPDAFKKLWRLMYYRFTAVHHLHNLVWVCTIGADPAWYPGDAYVDAVGTDEYPKNPGVSLRPRWEALKTLYGGKKLIALTEFGGVPDVEKMRLYGVRWSYFVSWTGHAGPHAVSKSVLMHRYQNANVITEGGLPQRI